METSAEKLLKKLELLYENIFALLNGFHEASKTLNDNISIQMKEEDGSSKEVIINSFQKLQQELTRLDSNYKSLINADNLSYIVNYDGSISQINKTSFINAEYLDSFKISDECFIDRNSIVDELVFPSVKLPITIQNKLISDINVKIFEIVEGWDLITENPSIIDLEYLESVGKITYHKSVKTLKTEKQQVKYFGKFNVETIKQLTTNQYEITINDTKYYGLNSIGASVELKVGDIFVSKNGNLKFSIDYIDKFKKLLKITRIAGSGTLTIGIDQLYFNEILENSDENVIGIPVKPLQKLVIFISTENFKNISYPSLGIKINTETYKVVYKSQTYTLDEFFSKFVTNFSEYLVSYINDIGIPINLGVKPMKPVLDKANFKVVQINKHVTDSKTVSQIEDLNKKKQSIDNEIVFKETQVNQIQQELETGKFKSAEEKNQKLNKITTYRQQINALKQNWLVIAQNIENYAIETGLKENKPKYRAIAFWPIQEPIYSPLTKPQNIIKYDVQYRYLSKGVDTVENTAYTMISEGKEITVAFSSWVDLSTRTLNKTKNVLGELIWEQPVMDSIDDININQLSIPINENESLEVRVRAVTEAGYPISPLKSEWSEIMRIDFPPNLKQNNINSAISKNITDLNKAEFENILFNKGLLSHISGTFKEGEKTFFHHAKDIASGQFTEEQKNIALDSIISRILKEIESLRQINTTNNVSINLVDFNNENFIVSNNTTMELFAGNYLDSINLLEKKTWGSIIRKRGNIRIRNNNQVPIEIKTLVPGTFLNSTNASQYYNAPIKTVSAENQTIFVQNPKQIIYFRNVDLTGQQEDIFKLVKPKLENTITNPRTTDIDNTAQDNEKNIVYREENVIKICKLLDEYATNFVAYTTEHPLYDYDNFNKIETEFDRLELYTANIKAQQYQSETLPEDVDGLGFHDNDIFAVGQNSCGAFFYPIIANPVSFMVVGNTTVSTLIIPKDSELIIPFIFEYRMIDRLGNVNGELNFDTTNSLVYSKKIGIDMLINNELFKFDINVTSKLRSKVVSIESMNINSVLGSYNDESPAEML
jgi:hypothetical protein